ncbi:MAG: hydrogenase nickel incorporation protein HypB [Pseudomonadota bacterium]
MCTVCGCGQDETRIEGKTPHDHGHPHGHEHAHGHAHSHDHAHGHTHDHVHYHEHDHADRLHPEGLPEMDGDNVHFGQGPAHAHVPGMSQEHMVRIEQDILGYNNEFANRNRDFFRERGILALNLVSSPGSGKTSLLTATIEQLQGRYPVCVIEGDQQTSNDAERIRATGVPAVQVNTGKGCHLDAHMIEHAVEHLQPADRTVLLIENVGNLVCPSSFDLGEAHKVVILSVTEGEDKPMKYPDMFHEADLMILNKADLLPYLDFDVDRCIEYAHRINPDLEVIQLSALRGDGMQAWLEWINRARASDDAADEVEALRQRVAELEAELAAARGARHEDPA